MPPSSRKPLDFEGALAELESIVGIMESGKISLDESLQRFERGMSLLKTCTDMLDAADQRIAALSETHVAEVAKNEAKPLEERQ